MAVSKQKLNNIRLAIKGAMTLWMPVLVILQVVHFSPEAVALIMAASTGSTDLIFRIWGVEDPSSIEKP